MLKFPWVTMGRDRGAVDSFLSLTVSLCGSLAGKVTQSCFQTLCKKFLVADQGPFDRDATMRVHGTIQEILVVVPMSGPTLLSTLLALYPHRGVGNVELHSGYLRNLLMLTSYATSLREPVLGAIVERLVMIDVEIKLEELPDDDDQLQQPQFEVGEVGAVGGGAAGAAAAAAAAGGGGGGGGKLESDAVKANPNTNPNSTNASLSGGAARVDAAGDGGAGGTLTAQQQDALLAEMLDQLMSQMFDYLAEFRTQPDFPVISRALMLGFERTVLTTYRSKYTQFLVFFMCSFSGDLSGSLLQMLHQRLFDVASSPQVREACALYIGSFLARAVYIPIETVGESLDMLQKFLLGYLDALYRQPGGGGGGGGRGGGGGVGDDLAAASPLRPDPQRHRIFYAVCQTVFYIFCFLRKDLLAKQTAWVRQTFEPRTIAECPLNPFRVCHKSVVAEFVKALRASSHADTHACLRVLKANREARRGEIFKVTRLAAYFPFDPYLLFHSSGRIDPLYRPWLSPSPAITFSQPAGSRRESASARRESVAMSLGSDRPGSLPLYMSGSYAARMGSIGTGSGDDSSSGLLESDDLDDDDLLDDDLSSASD